MLSDAFYGWRERVDLVVVFRRKGASSRFSPINMIRIDDFEWRNEDLVGAGSFGKVYLGRKVSSNAKVAVKVMTVDMMAERDLMRTLDHQNVVRFLHYLVKNTILFCGWSTFSLHPLCGFPNNVLLISKSVAHVAFPLTASTFRLESMPSSWTFARVEIWKTGSRPTDPSSRVAFDHLSCKCATACRISNRAM